MKLPRDIYGQELVKKLRKLGYEVKRQAGSHIIVSTQQNGENTQVIPDHKPLKVGTLNAILTGIANHFQTTKEEIFKQIKL